MRSPAICSRTNWSYGRSLLNASITQFDIARHQESDDRCSRRPCPHNEQHPASVGPSVRRNVVTVTAVQRQLHKLMTTRPPEKHLPLRVMEEARSDHRSLDESTSVDPPPELPPVLAMSIWPQESDQSHFSVPAGSPSGLTLALEAEMTTRSEAVLPSCLHVWPLPFEDHAHLAAPIASAKHNLRIRQFSACFFRRHLSTIISVQHSPNQQAAVDVSRRNCWTGFAALSPALLCIQREAAVSFPFSRSNDSSGIAPSESGEFLIRRNRRRIPHEPPPVKSRMPRPAAIRPTRASRFSIANAIDSRITRSYSTVFRTRCLQPFAPRLQMFDRTLSGQIRIA